MHEWEEWDLPYQNANKIDFFPNLIELYIYSCGRLKALPPGLGNLKSLKSLKLDLVYGLQSFFGQEIVEFDTNSIVLFPALSYLELKDAANFSVDFKLFSGRITTITIMPRLSKFVINECSGLKAIPFYMFANGLKISYYPNLQYFEIKYSSQSSLPEGFNQLTSIQQLVFRGCKCLDFGPDDLKHLTMLEELRIYDCPFLAQRFKEDGEISSSSSHVYKISISSEPINLHYGIGCDNCKMNPIVGKRYKCKDCYDEGVVSHRGGRGFDLCDKCYNTPSKRTDLVNQHHRQGHTFVLITKLGDRPVPIHPDDPSEGAEGGLVAAKSAY